MTAASAPGLDAEEGRLAISRRLMPSAMRLHSGRVGELQIHEATELEAAGITVEGELHPLANSILATMTDPNLVATVESTSIGRRPWLGTVWGRGATGVVGESPAQDTFVLHQTQRGLLPFHVANLVGVGPRPTPDYREIVVVAADVLATSRPHWQEPAVMIGMLIDRGLSDAAAEALADLHASRRASWRVTCLRTDHSGVPSDGEALVLDGGGAGYWSLAPDVEAPGTITFTPLQWGFIMSMLGDLLPTR